MEYGFIANLLLLMLYCPLSDCKTLYLPPYSPDFSPIENCWSKLKSVLRAIGARNYPDLVQAIEAAFAKVSLNDIKHWFTHCCYCTSAD
jgi:transposase